MNETTVGGRAFAAADAGQETEAIDFVRFCHRRRRVGWPELYDEMCAVAGRGLYRGYGPEELATIGIGFSLFQMPALAVIVSRVVAEEQERRRRTAEALRAAVIVSVPEVSDRVPAVATGDPVGNDVPTAARISPLAPEAHPTHDARQDPDPTDVGAPGHGSLRFAVAGAGA
jgi:hypothetical protein